MFNFYLNGKQVTINEDISLLEYLREQENLISVKNGCSEGVCGACMILVDGKAKRACLLTTAKVDNKEIQTVEGLTQFEKEVYRWAFSSAGAVQCGFCTPGMIISAQALLNHNVSPTDDEIKKAIRSNLCRCTGYIKIIEAIKLASTALKEGKLSKEKVFEGKIGERLPRKDALRKILGEAEYVDDLKMEGMLYGSAYRTKYPRALIKKIDISQALKHKDVATIITANDIPGKRMIGHLKQDWPALIAEGEETRYIGDALALIAARSKKALPEIMDLIEVEYEERTPLTNPKMAMEKDAPQLHPEGNLLDLEQLKRGNVDKAIAEADVVVTNTYETPFTEHAFLEPESALAFLEGNIITIYTGSQSVYDEQREIANLLGLPKERVRTISQYVGGAFGGKEDMSVQHHAALLTYNTKLPVKMTLSRKESIMVHPKRHQMEIEATTACDKNGNITAFKARIISDTGAYASLGGPVLQRACTHAAGPYRCPNIDIVGKAVYTNNPPGGAFRGFGVTQSVFASESNLNLLAEKLGISPWEIRYKNAVKPGDTLPNGQIADKSTAFIETLLAVKDDYEKSAHVGIACAMKNSGLGVGVPDFGRCRLFVKDDKVFVRSSAARVGQGLSTIMIQIVCETTGLSLEKVVDQTPDTYLTPNSGTSTASRQTLFTGEATKIAALKLKTALIDKTLAELEDMEFYGEYEGVTDPINSKKDHPVSHVTYGYATHVVILDEEGKIKEVVAAHDVGKAINPLNVEGQIEGGVVMGLGYALTEDYPLKDSIPQAKMGTLGLFRADKVPSIRSLIIEKSNSELAYGAKGIGEITTIPTAPAVQNAYYKYDGQFRTKLPLENTTYKPRKRK